jgi:CDK inhibitor PHO81
MIGIHKALDPVFFASQCGQRGSVAPSNTALNVDDVSDRRLSCLGAAVKFAKKNNLLGIFIDAAVLVRFVMRPQFFADIVSGQIQVPSLIDAIRDAGLVVCVYGASEKLNVGTEGSRVDAFLQGGMVIYKERGLYV